MLDDPSMVVVCVLLRNVCASHRIAKSSPARDRDRAAEWLVVFGAQPQVTEAAWTVAEVVETERPQQSASLPSTKSHKPHHLSHWPGLLRRASVSSGS